MKEKNYLRLSISAFVIEIISHNDKSSDIQKKLEDYFGDAVQVVWYIFPESKLVHVYTSLDNITICRGATICKASPVLPDFNIPAQDMFV